jgi:hypothetical protein
VIDSTEGRVSINRSNFTNCHSPHDGGALSIDSDLEIDVGFFNNCSSNAYGGAIALNISHETRILNIFNTKFYNCTSKCGGALYIMNVPKNINFLNVEFRDNTVTEDGHDIYYGGGGKHTDGSLVWNEQNVDGVCTTDLNNSFVWRNGVSGDAEEDVIKILCPDLPDDDDDGGGGGDGDGDYESNVSIPVIAGIVFLGTIVIAIFFLALCIVDIYKKQTNKQKSLFKPLLTTSSGKGAINETEKNFGSFLVSSKSKESVDEK